MSAAPSDPLPRQPLPIAGRKRPIAADPPHAKRLRSKNPARRCRIPLLPIVVGPGAASSHFINHAEDEAESSATGVHSEISSEFSGVRFASSGAPPPARARKRIARFHGEYPGDEFRRITRSYSKQQEQLYLADRPRAGSTTSMPEASDGSLELTVSELSHISGGFPGGKLKPTAAPEDKAEDISESSCPASVSKAISPNSAAEYYNKVQISDDRSDAVVTEPRDVDLDLTSSLACSERLPSADVGSDDDRSSEYSTCNELTVSEYETEVVYMTSDSGFSEYSLSDLFDSSGDDFSERSGDSSSAPSPTFSLFLQLTQQFTRLSSAATRSSTPAAGVSEDSVAMKFEDADDEESYSAVRGRERREVLLHNLDESYRALMGTKDRVLRERLLMVNWIIEYASVGELQDETLFLGVSLMDRFLNCGYFNSERNLQLLGIACVTLATRIEEKQPYNSIRTKSFMVRSSVYSRCEAVAMEWLVMEVLNFQCFLPTVHNFLWYYLKAVKADDEVKMLTYHLAVLSLLDHNALRFWPSTVAACLVALACLATNHEASFNDIMEIHVRTKNDDLCECFKTLEWLIKYVRDD